MLKRRLLCLLSAFIVLFSCSVPAFATAGFGQSPIPVGVEVDLDIASLASLIAKGSVLATNFIASIFDDDVCPSSTELNRQHNFIPKRTQIDGQVGVYYVCEYCGRNAGEVLDQQYTDYVAELPATQVNSSGGFHWKPAWEDFVDQRVDIKYAGSSSGTLYPNRLSNIDNTNGWSSKCAPGSYVMITEQRDGRYYYCTWMSVVAPYDARYELVSASLAGGVDTYAIAGQTFRMGDSPGQSGVGSLVVPWPEFIVTPVGGALESLSPDTRISFSGDGSSAALGYIGGDGTLYQSSVGTIFDEDTTVYNNPVTNSAKTVSSWEYDYSDRTYSLTTTEGDEITVTYGDKNITINDAGETYTVYYLIEHDESLPELEPGDIADDGYVHTWDDGVITTEPTCTASGVKTYTCVDCGATKSASVPALGHDYHAEITVEPTCTATGVKTYTCSRCGRSYRESVSALGHSWQKVFSVPTTYNSETGVLVQQGYTLYKCLTCGDEYRIDSESTGLVLPDAGSGGVSTGGGSSDSLGDSDVGKGFLATIAHGLTEDLPEVLELISRWFTVIPGLHEGFNQFLKQELSFFPSEILLLFSFSIGITVLVGFCRFLFRR